MPRCVEKSPSTRRRKSTPASTQRRIGFALSARGGGLGSPCLAARRRHHGYELLVRARPLCNPLSARRHESWSNGSHHSLYIHRENAALAPVRALLRGCRTYALWRAGDYVTSTPSHLPARWRHGHPRRNADDDAREVAAHLRCREAQCPLLSS